MTIHLQRSTIASAVVCDGLGFILDITGTVDVSLATTDAAAQLAAVYWVVVGCNQSALRFPCLLRILTSLLLA